MRSAEPRQHGSRQSITSLCSPSCCDMHCGLVAGGKPLSPATDPLHVSASSILSYCADCYQQNCIPVVTVDAHNVFGSTHVYMRMLQAFMSLPRTACVQA